MCLSSFLSTFYFRDHSLPSICSCLLCHILNDYVYIDWFLGSLFWSIDLHVHVYDNIILSKLHVYLLFFLPISLCLQMLWGFFLSKLKVPSSLASIKSVCTIFSNAIFLLHVCHILVVLTTFKLFNLLLHLLWSVILNFWCSHCNFLEGTQTAPL